MLKMNNSNDLNLKLQPKILTFWNKYTVPHVQDTSINQINHFRNEKPAIDHAPGCDQIACDFVAVAHFEMAESCRH